MDNPIIRADIEQYARECTRKPSALLQNVQETTESELRYSEMLSGRVQGQFLRMLVLLTGAKRILELGTFTGYSALSMAGVLPEDGELVTCDYNERYEKIARKFFKESPHGHKIKLHMGPALETLKTLEGPFDMAFLDADKNHYPEYYETILPMMSKGGLIVIDNALWSGKVLQPKDDKTRAIDQLNRKLAEDERVDQVLLTLRDGVHLARKR